MPTIVELQAQRATEHKRAEEIIQRAKTDGRDLTPEENQTVDGHFATIDKLQANIETISREDRLNKLSAELNAPQGRKSAPTAGDRLPRVMQPGESNKILRDWANYNQYTPDLNAINRAADLGFNVSSPQIVVRALTSTTAGSGAELKSTAEFMGELQRELVSFAPILQYCKIQDTETGTPLPFPMMNDSTKMVRRTEGATQIGEKTPVTSTKTLGAYEYVSSYPFTKTLLQDTAYDLEAELEILLGETQGRALEEDAILGTGTNQPQGIWKAAENKIVLSASTTAIKAVDLLNLQAGVARAYRGRGTYAISDGVYLGLRKEVDTTGRLIWQVGTEGDTIHGRPYFVTDLLEDVGGTNKKLAVYADLSRYVIRRARQMTFQRLTEKYVEQGMIAIVAEARWDCAWIGTNAAIARMQTPAS